MKTFTIVARNIARSISSFGVWIGERIGLRLRQIRYEVVEDLPDDLAHSTLYIAGAAPNMWAAAMLCPCGCKNVIQLNLLTQAKPCWKLTLHEDGSASLTPSVWRSKGCRSHFWLRRGRVEWC